MTTTEKDIWFSYRTALVNAERFETTVRSVHISATESVHIDSPIISSEASITVFSNPVPVLTPDGTTNISLGCVDITASLPGPALTNQGIITAEATGFRVGTFSGLTAGTPVLVRMVCAITLAPHLAGTEKAILFVTSSDGGQFRDILTERIIRDTDSPHQNIFFLKSSVGSLIQIFVVADGTAPGDAVKDLVFGFKI